MGKLLLDESRLHDYFTRHPVELAYLLGSQASRDTKPYSDVDFAVLFSAQLSKQRRFSERMEFIADLTVMLKTDSIDVVDLNEASPFFRFEAIKHRKELFVRNEKVRIAFETKTLSEYFDRQYYLRRHTVLGIEYLKEEYGVKTR